MHPKISMIYRFVEGPWGGSNQFLKALRNYFREIGVYSETLGHADVILFNSHHFLEDVFRVKKKNPNKIFIHRIDGPLFYGRGKDKLVDEIIFQFNELVADGTVFQSNWSKQKNYEIGMQKSKYETNIINAPEPTLFNLEGKKHLDENKTKLIAISWSGNIRKGFDIYNFLDENLDFNKYEMTFVGNSPVAFKNVKWITPVPTKELADILKRHDIFVIASKADACSNTLIEALHCGLPAVARNAASHPEIIGGAGEFFEGKGDVINAIEKVIHDYTYYQQRIKIPTLDEVGQRYYEFAQTIYEDYLNSDYLPKQRTLLKSMRIRIKIAKWKFPNKVQSIIKGIRKKRRFS